MVGERHQTHRWHLPPALSSSIPTPRLAVNELLEDGRLGAHERVCERRVGRLARRDELLYRTVQHGDDGEGEGRAPPPPSPPLTCAQYSAMRKDEPRLSSSLTLREGDSLFASSFPVACEWGGRGVTRGSQTPLVLGTS